MATSAFVLVLPDEKPPLAGEMRSMVGDQACEAPPPDVDSRCLFGRF